MRCAEDALWWLLVVAAVITTILALIGWARYPRVDSFDWGGVLAMWTLVGGMGYVRRIR